MARMMLKDPDWTRLEPLLPKLIKEKKEGLEKMIEL